MGKKNNWSFIGGTDPNWIRRFMSYLSMYVRNRQYTIFVNELQPTKRNNIIDIGTSPDETLSDTNFFEKKYPYKRKLAIASVEDCNILVKKYKLSRYIQIKPGRRFKIKSKSFDYAVSWATLEHVGTWKNQKLFLTELCRIGKKIFITTPDRVSIYEPHTGTFFLHWLPPRLFRKIIKFIGKSFWSEEKNLNLLSFNNVKSMVADSNLMVERFKLFGIFPSHILIYGETE